MRIDNKPLSTKLTLSKKRVLILGPYPPPSGGVSIHILRLSSFLKNKFSIDFIDESKLRKDGIFNLRSFNVFRYLKKIWNSDVLYINSGNSLLRIVHIVTAKLFAKKSILVIHSYREKKKPLYKFIDEFCFNMANRIIVVNSSILDNIKLKQDKYVIRNAFLPPLMEEEAMLPLWISDWIKDKRDKGKLIICANAWRLDEFNNEDIYGIDISIAIAKRLLDKNIPATFIFVISSDSSKNPKYHHYISMIDNFNLNDSFLLVNENLSFAKLIAESDIVIRPTNTDGDALTIREGLYLGKPVLASDVVERPQGTFLFKSRDESDFEEQLLQMIKMVSIKKEVVEQKTTQDYSGFYVELIESLA